MILKGEKVFLLMRVHCPTHQKICVSGVTAQTHTWNMKAGHKSEDPAKQL